MKHKQLPRGTTYHTRKMGTLASTPWIHLSIFLAETWPRRLAVFDEPCWPKGQYSGRRWSNRSIAVRFEHGGANSAAA